jgi:copper chaperone NosL
MKIMDQKFGTEVVTRKGKSFKFDSDECLMGYLNTGTLKPDQIRELLVTDYMSPGSFIDARQAFFLYCENLPSPMGGHIAAFRTKEDAEKVLNEKGGKGVIIGWEAIQELRKMH